MSTTHQHDSDSSTDSNDRQRPAQWIDDGLDRSPESASPLSRPNENSSTKIRGRVYDQGASDGRDLEAPDSPKRGGQSGRRLGGCISRKDCESAKWERLRKYDEGVLTYDKERHEREGDEYVPPHGAGAETNGDDRIRSMTLLSVVSNVADTLNADSATENRARTLVAGLDESDTNGRPFEATATGALVVARDEFVARRIHGISADSAEIQQIQQSLERATSPAKRFRVLNNLRHVTDDERLVGRSDDDESGDKRSGGVLQRRLVASAENVADSHGFVLKNVLESVEWSA